MHDSIGSIAAPADIDTSAGKCPVDFETRSLWGLLGRGGSSSSSNTESKSATATASNPETSAIPASLEEAARHAQTPHFGQRLPLSTHRLESTIPRSGAQPAHQIRVTAQAGTDAITSTSTSTSSTTTTTDAEDSTWVYPSEQQVFNAMKRKGWKGIEEESIPSFLQIHNSVNERSWKDVQKWEKSDSVELSRFEGRPKDITPKAWLLSTLGLREKPFDRHDWYVVHNTTTTTNDDTKTNNCSPAEKRYVLDFYMTDSDSAFGGVPRVEIDVRPALDSPEAVWQRGEGLLKDAFPGIARELEERSRRWKEAISE